MNNSLLSWGAVGDDSTECATAFNNAITALNAAGGGTLYIPTGTYKVSSDVTWASNVNLVGDGIGQSVIKFYGTARFLYSGSVGAPLTNCDFTDFEIDGTNQTTADVGRKGFFFIYCNDVNWTRVKVGNTGATGFGSDFLVGCSFTDCIATGCGRLGAVGDPGCSGFGVGTGKHATENTTLTNCTSTNNKRYGVFFEVQVAEASIDGVTNFRSQGYQVQGGTFDGNQWGVGDCGVDGLVVNNADITNNVAEGFYNGAPSLYNVAGINGTISNCEISGNGAPGIEPADGGTGYTLTNNNVHDNGA